MEIDTGDEENDEQNDEEYDEDSDIDIINNNHNKSYYIYIF